MAKKSSKRKSTKSSGSARSKKLSPIPPGYHSVTPYIVVNDAAKAIEFYKSALGAKELSRAPTPDGKILNAQVKIGDSVVMLMDEFGGSLKSPTSAGTSTIMLHIYTKDVDKFWERATGAGAKITMPLDKTFWGERYGQFEDPFGHVWSVSMRVKMSPEEMKEKQQAAMAAMVTSQQSAGP